MVIWLGASLLVVLGSPMLYRWITTLRVAGTRARPPRIVVLPFENLGSPEDAYFSAGMAEEITSRLASLRGLGVVSGTTAMGYRRSGKTVKDIGKDLEVDYVLGGSVRCERAAGREGKVRITPQLIRVADDTLIWTGRYDGELAQVLALQSEVSEEVVRAMGLRLLPRERSALSEIATDDMEAYDFYLRGRALAQRWLGRADSESAVKMFQAAVDRDPRFAQAHAALAEANLSMYWAYFDRSEARLTRAREAAERALALRPELAEAHAALADYYYRGLLDYPRALEQYAEALRIQPNSSAALAGRSFVLRRQGHWDESAEVLGRATELEPLSILYLENNAYSCVLAGRYDEAYRGLGQVIALNPQYGDPYGERAWFLVLWRGDTERAHSMLGEARAVPDLDEGEGLFTFYSVKVGMVRRDFEDTLRILDGEARASIDNHFFVAPIELLRARVLRQTGRGNLARRSFETARVELERRVGEDPTDHRLHGALGIAYAGLGRAEEAVGEARRGCDLMPASKDAWRSLWRLEDLAVVYTILGRHEDAIAALDDLLGRSGQWTPNALRLEPEWDPLRSHPRFQALLAKYEVRE
jgi:serine/threonine-protein kinase